MVVGRILVLVMLDPEAGLLLIVAALAGRLVGVLLALHLAWGLWSDLDIE